MGSTEQGPGRGFGLAASADWRTVDLPAALQGGARRAIFRELYKGAEAAARLLGSANARDGEGCGDTRAGSRDAEAAGLGPASDPRLGAWRSSGLPEPAPLGRKGVACRRSGVVAASQEVKVQNAGLGCLLEEERSWRPAENPSARDGMTRPTPPPS